MKRLAIIGWPIGHSRSPMIHRYWMERYGVAGSYDRREVDPADADSFFSGFAASGLDGANVTVPFKEIAARNARRREAIVERTGAANTLWLEDGELAATNTDVYGFLANLDDRAPGWDVAAGRALVLGAGGAAAAVVEGLVSRGFAVDVANRTLARAEILAARYPGRVVAHPSGEATSCVGEATLIVNTTSLGMKDIGRIDLDFSAAKSGAWVTDIVYAPLRTAFLAAAAERGLGTVDGLGMLLHQAAAAFEKWFGIRPEVTADLRARVEADL